MRNRAILKIIDVWANPAGLAKLTTAGYIFFYAFFINADFKFFSLIHNPI